MERNKGTGLDRVTLLFIADLRPCAQPVTRHSKMVSTSYSNRRMMMTSITVLRWRYQGGEQRRRGETCRQINIINIIIIVVVVVSRGWNWTMALTTIHHGISAFCLPSRCFIIIITTTIIIIFNIPLATVDVLFYFVVRLYCQFCCWMARLF